MFSVFPQYYYDDYDNYYRALAAQRARERREAEYRARLQEARQRQQLEELLRRNAYQNHLAHERRRRSMYPYYSGFDSDEEYLESPNYLDYFEHPAYEPMQRPRSQDFLDSLQRHHLPAHDEPVPRNITTSPKRRESPVLPQEHMEHPTKAYYQNSARRSPTPGRSSSSPKRTTIPIRGPSPRPDVRDQAARKIQAFLRANMPRYKALKAISSVAQEFQRIVDNFTFPTSLDFAESDSMQLLFTPRNAPIHLHEHTLLNFLSRLDSIDSHGDKDVRAVRKDLVKRIESELEKLDAEKLALWEAQRAAPMTAPAENEVLASSTLGDSMLESEDAPMATVAGAMETNQAPLPEQLSSVIAPAEDEVSTLDDSTLESEDVPMATVEEAVETNHAPLPDDHSSNISPPTSDESESLVTETEDKPTLAKNDEVSAPSTLASGYAPMVTVEGTAETDQASLPGEHHSSDISPPSSDDSESPVIEAGDKPTLAGTCHNQPAELPTIRPSEERMHDETAHQEFAEARDYEIVPPSDYHCELPALNSDSPPPSDPSDNTPTSWEIIPETNPSNDMEVERDQPISNSADVQDLVSSVNDTIQKLLDVTYGNEETNNHNTSASSSSMPVEVSV